MKILYLYSELMPYQLVVFKELVKNYSAEIVAIHWDKKKLTPSVLIEMDSVTYIPRSNFNTKKEILSFVEEVKPDLIYCSGWMDNYYSYVAKKMKKKGIITVAGSDTQWTGGKQWLNVLLSRFRHRQWFSHIWIAGTYQYEYAKKLGFKNKNIIFHHYTADVHLFHNVSIEYKKDHYPKTFLYIGRFHPVKGLEILQKAWNDIADKKGWTLTLVGSGKINFHDPTITVKKFMEPEGLAQEMQNAGCFILPSVKEPWAVVLHEASSAGLPIISTEICGAAPYFVINNYNGYLVKEKSVEELKNAMANIINLSDEQLMNFSYRSRKLSTRITPEIVAANLIQLIKDNALI